MPEAPERLSVEPLPLDTARFIEANIDSVDQLEILRILAADPDKEWTGADLARAAQTPAHAITTHLDTLERRGLLTVARGAALSCRYGARTPELECEVRRLLRLYDERPVTLIRMVYARASGTLKSFSDAFRIRKED